MYGTLGQQVPCGATDKLIGQGRWRRSSNSSVFSRSEQVRHGTVYVSAPPHLAERGLPLNGLITCRGVSLLLTETRVNMAAQRFLHFQRANGTLW